MSRPVLDWLVMRADRMPEEPALRTPTLRWTRAQLLDAVDGLAAALTDAALQPGDRLAALLDDDAPAVVLVNAARRMGLTLVPLNRRAAVPELEQQLRHAAVQTLVYDRANAAAAAGLDLPALARHRVEVLLAGAACRPRWATGDRVDLDAPAVIVYTSGTTGRPKGALLTHGNLAASAHDWASRLRPQRDDRWLACLPWFHVAGLAVLTRSGRWGAELEVAGRSDAEGISAALDGGASHVSLVPVQLERLLAVRAHAGPPRSLRAVLLGGGPIPAGLLHRARAAGYPVLTTYGMTETASGIALGGGDEETLADASLYRPLPRAELRIAGSAAADGSGEILVRGPMVFAGYVDDAGSTAAVLRDGWLHTGDIGALDELGRLRVLDRRDDLIVSGGENIYPAEVEAVLAGHPAVRDVAVFARPDPRWGAVPVAAVVAAGDLFPDDELEAYCRERLAGYKVPVRFLRVDELPRDELGKVRRRALAALVNGDGS